MTLISKQNFSDASGLSKIPIPGLSSWLMEFLKINHLNAAVKEAGDLEGAAFASHMLDAIGVSVVIDGPGLKHIPANGAFIAIANHPYGGIESLALLKTLSEVRAETLYMGNFLLKKIPNLEKCIIAVNPFEKVQNPSSISGLKQTFKNLKEGIPVAIFPAGEVSSYDFKTRSITDREWHPIVGKIIAKSGVPVLPVYFHGDNGLFFSLLKSVHPMLQTSMLIPELFNKRGHVLKITIGKPIILSEAGDEFNAFPLKNLRKSIYALKKSR